MAPKLIEFFNIMAILTRNILNHGFYSDKDFQSILHDPDNAILTQLIQSFPELINPDRTPNTIRLAELNRGFFAILNTFKTQTIYSQLLLLYYMDRAIESCYIRNCNFEDDVEQFDALNQNIEQTQIAIIKKTKCCWEHTSPTENLTNKIFSAFYYIDYQALPNTHVINHIVDAELAAPRSPDCYKVAISPIMKRKILTLSAPYQRKNRKTGALQSLFRIEKLEHEKEVTDSVMENIIAAGQQNTDILVFPEMLGSISMLNQILAEIKEKHHPVPSLIVFPSIWEKAENDEQNTNRSCMILNGREILFQQKKYCNFRYFEKGKPVYEDINDSSDITELHLLHIKGLGRICIIICYDYLEAENRERIIKNLQPTLICSPSFSTGSFDFRLLAQSNLYRNCNWIWCNTCSASNHTDKIQNFEVTGIITTLSRHCDFSKDKGIQINCSGVTLCQKENCDHCIFYAEIPINGLKNLEKVR